ncbi:hypothetical protein GOC74_06340 [Halomicrobium mukohataei]|uniref:Uncharacterized protein n=1 Tax=Halomicrobium mukohataei TaxID=57705 RepID=A0A847UDS0_9EURY|nr:HTH domain-containing protein [Halomicrobium mukohataei]NLV09544.1 hypothetical protein [Halomicrobium mukohataei]
MSQMSTGVSTVQLCMRRFAPDAAQQRQREVVARLEALSDRGLVEEVTREWWSTRVCTPGTDGNEGASCPMIVEELLDAVEGTGISLQPAFRHATGHETADSDVLYLPVICLVVREDGEIAGIYPACDGQTHHRVKDALDRIESGEAVSNL